jgi:hypothetical protein
MHAVAQRCHAYSWDTHGSRACSRSWLSARNSCDAREWPLHGEYNMIYYTEIYKAHYNRAPVQVVPIHHVGMERVHPTQFVRNVRGELEAAYAHLLHMHIHRSIAHRALCCKSCAWTVTMCRMLLHAAHVARCTPSGMCARVWLNGTDRVVATSR